MSPRPVVRIALVALLATAAGAARAQEAAPDSAAAPVVAASPDSAAVPAGATTSDPAATPAPAHRRDGLESLEPGLADGAYRLAPGPRPYLHRLAVTPAYGALGSERLFAMRVAYNPNEWLGYEAELCHNPGQAVHAVVHRLSLVVRRPLPGRLQPYVTAGYGMTVVLPGRSVNADAVTKNMLALGGGLELYIRDDLALRAEMRRSTVFGRQANREGLVAYDYVEQTLGLAFYRTLRP